jgi:hypothetical protein
MRIAKDLASRRFPLTLNRFKLATAFTSIFFLAFVISIVVRKLYAEEFWKAAIISIAGGFGGVYVGYFFVRFAHFLTIKIEYKRLTRG